MRNTELWIIVEEHWAKNDFFMHVNICIINEEQWVMNYYGGTLSYVNVDVKNDPPSFVPLEKWRVYKTNILKKQAGRQ